MGSVSSLFYTAGEWVAWCCSLLDTVLQAAWTAVRQACSCFWASDHQQLDYDPSIFEVDYGAINAESARVGIFNISGDTWVIARDDMFTFFTQRLQGGPAENADGGPDGDEAEAIEDE